MGDNTSARSRAGKNAAFTEVAKVSPKKKQKLKNGIPGPKTGFQRKETAGEEKEDKKREREKAKGPETEWRRGGKVGMAQPGLSHAARA
ncbi:uncharacterized protein BO87DRAFT_187778 [Aspergillus neoniger CBS 115656]|uniref:Uncharacterized protein n=1 Tax=Aspergillus neoniger (strain CBS 115656) TaxID=1448310 RepID=A0A318ZPX8_ASPNB|nr:hypothetical protein BO87DRAFT_187778 [Aspergillus neoniger CBS 115656]PYH37872.1 hypothetical protein BO87DRAFT_187778 [Aspergillus neoniger CBS 115656]